MNARVRQYLFGSIFFAVGVYQLYIRDYLEAALYMVAGLAFVTNSLVSEPRLFAYKKILVIITWIFIVSAGLLFFYLLRYKFL